VGVARLAKPAPPIGWRLGFREPGPISPARCSGSVLRVRPFRIFLLLQLPHGSQSGVAPVIVFRTWDRSCNFVRCCGWIRRRLQLRAWILRDVGEIRRQSWRRNGVWVVRAAGCNPLHWAWRDPPYLKANRAKPPFVPGLECLAGRGAARHRVDHSEPLSSHASDAAPSTPFALHCCFSRPLICFAVPRCLIRATTCTVRHY
jgi:hypothetical protein